MSEATLFKSAIPSMTYLFKNGKAATFVQGRFSTAIKAEIDELNAEIEAGNQYIFFDKNEPVSKVVTSEEFLKDMKDKIIAEYLESQESKELPAQTVARLVPTSTSDIAPVTIGTAAKLFK